MKLDVFKRTLAALVTGAMVAGSVGAVSAGAKTMTNVIPGSNLKFDMNVTAMEDVNDGPTICVEISGKSSNPDFQVFALVVEGSGNCTFLDGVVRSKQVTGSATTGWDGLTENIGFAYIMADTACTGEFSFKMYYTPKNPQEVCDYNFSVGITSYLSNEEGVSVSLSAIEALENGNIHDSASVAQYRLGDVNNSGQIEMNDAYSAMRIANHFSSGSGTNAQVNHYLQTNAEWKQEFPNLICAEVADVDFDGMVELEDAQAIMTYTSEAAIGKDHINNAIGKITTSTIEI